MLRLLESQSQGGSRPQASCRILHPCAEWHVRVDKLKYIELYLVCHSFENDLSLPFKFSLVVLQHSRRKTPLFPCMTVSWTSHDVTLMKLEVEITAVAGWFTASYKAVIVEEFEFLLHKVIEQQYFRVISRAKGLACVLISKLLVNVESSCRGVPQPSEDDLCSARLLGKYCLDHSF